MASFIKGRVKQACFNLYAFSCYVSSLKRNARNIEISAGYFSPPAALFIRPRPHVGLYNLQPTNLHRGLAGNIHPASLLMHMNVLCDLLSTDIRKQKSANYHSDLVEETFKILRAISYE